MRSWATLLRWLGPWAAESAVPEGLDRREVTVEGPRRFRAFVYRPAQRDPDGAYLICPGVHYEGPDDGRLDRFARILAAAGNVVLVPFLPDYIALRVTPAVIEDAAAAFDALLSLPEVVGTMRPGVFSISFGSLPALRLAASAGHRDRVGALLVFGGYASFADTIDFCLTGEVGGQPRGRFDPLNRPVVLLNLLDFVEGAPADTRALKAGLREFVEKTWTRMGREALKEPARYLPVAEGIAARLPEDARGLFLMGCGAHDGLVELCREALARGAERWAELDPRPHLAGIQCPVFLVHGLDDDVIPHTQMEVLRRALPPAVRVKASLTGLYGHTGQSGVIASLRQLPAVAVELWRMVGLLWALRGGGRH